MERYPSSASFTERTFGATTAFSLSLLDSLYNAEVRFKWPSLKDYVQPEGCGGGVDDDGYDVLPSSVKDFCSKCGCVDFNFDRIFRLRVKWCIFDEAEWKKATVLLESPKFGKYDEDKFIRLLQKDEETVRVCSETKRLLEISAAPHGVYRCYDKCYEEVLSFSVQMLLIPEFFRFTYERHQPCSPKVRSVLSLDTLCSVCPSYARLDRTLSLDSGGSTAGPEDRTAGLKNRADVAFLCTAAYFVANRYLEIYHVLPMERWLSGVFFLNLRNAFATDIPLHDDAILFHAEKKVSEKHGLSLRVANKYRSYFPNGLALPLRAYFSDDWKLSMQTKRDLHDCPREYVDVEVKRKINAILNVNTLLRRYSKYLQDVVGISRRNNNNNKLCGMREDIAAATVTSVAGTMAQQHLVLELDKGDAERLEEGMALACELYFDLGRCMDATATIIARFYGDTQSFILNKFGVVVVVVPGNSACKIVEEAIPDGMEERRLVRKLMKMKKSHPIKYASRRDHSTYLFSLRAWNLHLDRYELCPESKPKAVLKTNRRRKDEVRLAVGLPTSRTVIVVSRKEYLSGLNGMLQLNRELFFHRDHVLLTKTCLYVENWKRFAGIREAKSKGKYDIVLSQDYS